MAKLLALAVFLAVALPAAGAMTAFPYSAAGAPGSYPKPTPPKDQARLGQPTPLVRFVPVEAITPRVATLSELVASPLPCPDIRRAIEAFGHKFVRAEAKRRGYTKKQIDEAMACVAEKKS